MSDFKPTVKDFLTSCYLMSKETVIMATEIKNINPENHFSDKQMANYRDMMSGTRLHLHTAKNDLDGLSKFDAKSDTILMQACVTEAEKHVKEAIAHFETIEKQNRVAVPKNTEKEKEQLKTTEQALREREMQRERERSKERDRQRM